MRRGQEAVSEAQSFCYGYGYGFITGAFVMLVIVAVQGCSTAEIAPPMAKRENPGARAWMQMQGKKVSGVKK